MLAKVLLKNNDKLKLFLALFGAILGLTLLLSTIDLYIDFSRLFKYDKEILSPDYLVVNKKVSALKLIGLGSTEFTKEEITDLQSQPFIDKAAPFQSNNFKVMAKIQASDRPMYSEMFFESVPDEFLDVTSTDWHFSKGDTAIPIIIPRDYLNLYNFGFAPSQGLPMISSGMASMVSFSIEILNNNNTIDKYRGRIVGFSERVNSILVPSSFLSWANKEYSNNVERKPQRVLISSSNPSDSRLINYLKEKGFETQNEKLKSGKLNYILRILLFIISIIASAIIFLAFNIFLLTFQLMIERNIKKIKLLIDLGYKTISIWKVYLYYYIAIIIILLVISLSCVTIAKIIIFNILSEMNIDILKYPNISVFLYGILICFLLASLNTIFIYKKISSVNNITN